MLFLTALGVAAVLLGYLPDSLALVRHQRQQLAPLPEAVVVVTVERGKLPVYVTRGKRRLAVPPSRELSVVRLVEGKEPLERLAGKTVSLVRSLGSPDRWEMYAGAVWSPAWMNLPDNVFVVRQVLLSTSENPIELSSGGRVQRVKSGHAILALG